MARGLMDEELVQLATRETYLISTMLGISRFSDKMLLEYNAHVPKYGHSWLEAPPDNSISFVIGHLKSHWKHTLDKDFQDEQLIGLALMCMMVVQRREMQKLKEGAK